MADRVGLTEEQVEERLGPDAGRIVIMESDQLGTVQTAVELIRKLSVWLAIAILVLFAVAVYLAEGRRRETLRAVGITFVVVGALLLVIRRLAGNWIVDTLASGESVRDSASNAWFIGTDLLAGIAWTAIAYGAIVILAAWIAGPSRPAVSVRQRLAPSLRDRPGLVYAVVGLLYLLVVAWGPTPAFRQPWSILIFAALTGLGVEAFRRLTVARVSGRLGPSFVAVGDGVEAEMGSRLDRSVQRAVARRRIFPYLAAATLVLALVAGFVMILVDRTNFPNYGIAVWWAIVTLATVGYGDVVPTTPLGRIVGSAVIILGVTFLAFLTATVTSLFVSSRPGGSERARARRARGR